MHRGMRSVGRSLAVALLALGLALSEAAAQQRIDGASPVAGAWTVLPALPPAVEAAEAWVRPERFAAARLDVASMRVHLSQAPLEQSGLMGVQPLVVVLPDPSGGMRAFAVVESPVMHPDLAAQLPDVRTYLGSDVLDRASKLRLDLTPQGLHAQVLAPGGSWYIDPVSRDDAEHHASYFRRDLRPGADHAWRCMFDGGAGNGMRPVDLGDEGGSPEAAPVTLRTYMIAIAATGEYTTYHGGVTQALASIATSVNRLNGIYERDAGVRFMLVADNNKIVYPNAGTDPFANEDPITLINAATSVMNGQIGSANYDVGHVYGRFGGGGVAGALGIVCTSSKAQGASCFNPPTGDPFWVDYVAHELGHQFGGNHNFNGGSTCGGAGPASKATEPGSGCTIMGYAGLCGSQNDLQPNSDDMFGHVNVDEIFAFVSSATGNGCATATATGNNTPVLAALTSYTIPKQTPFELTASATDPEGDALTYSWEQRDTGPIQNATAADNGTSPLFRPFDPSASPTRIFPRLNELLTNTTKIGEKLPVLNRQMKMRVVVRDNNPAGGGVTHGNVTHTIAATAGPFVVTSPNTAVTLSGTATVTWNVASTNLSPVNATLVDILLSTDGGQTFPTVLTSGTPNDGSHAVTLPSISTNQARIKVKGTGNVFFDLSNTNFTITPGCYADCDQNGSLNIFDYTCFGNAFATSQPYADCDKNGLFNVFDYICFANLYAAGCP